MNPPVLGNDLLRPTRVKFNGNAIAGGSLLSRMNFVKKAFSPLANTSGPLPRNVDAVLSKNSSPTVRVRSIVCR